MHRFLAHLVLGLLIASSASAQTMRGYYEGRPIYTENWRYLVKNENGDIDDLILHRMPRTGAVDVRSAVSLGIPIPGRPQFRLSPRALPIAQGSHVWLMGTADSVYVRRYTALLHPDSSFGHGGWAVLGRRKEAPSNDRFNWALSLDKQGGGLVAGDYLYRFDALGHEVAPTDTSRQCLRQYKMQAFPLSEGRILYFCNGRLRRYAPEGQRDSSFNGGADIVLFDNSSVTPPTYAAYEDTTRRRVYVNVYAYGIASYGPNRLLAFAENGEPDSAFNGTGVLVLPNSLRLRGGSVVQTNWDVLPFGWGQQLLVAVTEGGPVVARMRPDGTLDEGYAGADEATRGTDVPGFRLLGGGPPAGYFATSTYLDGNLMVVHYARQINTNVTFHDYESFIALYGGLPVAAEAPQASSTGAGSTLRLSSLVPHPAARGAMVRLTLAGTVPGEQVTVDVIDALGRSVHSLSAGSDGTVEMETTTLAPGVYVVRAIGEWSGVALTSLVVAR